MRIQQLQYFITLAHTTSLTKTAKSMEISIPSLSESITHIEEEVNHKLFTRTSRGYFLTEAGEMFLADVEPIVLQYQEAINRLNGIGIDKTIRFGIDASIYPLFFAKMINDYQDSHDDENIELIRTNFADFKDNLLENKIDLCYSYEFEPLPKQLVFTPLFKNDICVCMPKNNKLFNKKMITLRDLYDQNIYYDQSYETTELKHIYNDLVEHDTMLHVFESKSFNSISMLEVEVHNGIMIMHKDKTDIYTGNMVMREIQGCSETYGLIYRQEDEALVNGIVKTIKQNY